MERNLEGRVAIVTGAAEGIGYTTVERLASAGAHVAVADLNEQAAQQAAQRLTTAGHTAVGVAVDVSDEGAVRRMIEQVTGQLGPVEILINNAGIAADAADVQDFDIATWDRVVAVNLRGVFLCCRFALPGMLALGRGRIVNVASIAGKEGNPRMSAYSAAKAGVIAFTKSLAKEVAQKGIYVNSVAPAVIHTRILDQLPQSAVDYMTARIPMGRVGRPEEVAALIHWLASDECSFTTGQCLDISGGRATY